MWDAQLTFRRIQVSAMIFVAAIAISLAPLAALTPPPGPGASYGEVSNWLNSVTAEDLAKEPLDSPKLRRIYEEFLVTFSVHGDVAPWERYVARDIGSRGGNVTPLLLKIYDDFGTSKKGSARFKLGLTSGNYPAIDRTPFLNRVRRAIEVDASNGDTSEFQSYADFLVGCGTEQDVKYIEIMEAHDPDFKYMEGQRTRIKLHRRIAADRAKANGESTNQSLPRDRSPQDAGKHSAAKGPAPSQPPDQGLTTSAETGAVVVVTISVLILLVAFYGGKTR